MIVNRQVYKYQIPYNLGQEAQVKMPEEAKIVKTGMQGNAVCMWAEVALLRGHGGDATKYENRRFTLLGTGWDIPESAIYIGTQFVGVFVWHLYELK